jgi:hypothetical protein
MIDPNLTLKFIILSRLTTIDLNLISFLAILGYAVFMVCSLFTTLTWKGSKSVPLRKFVFSSGSRLKTYAASTLMRCLKSVKMFHTNKCAKKSEHV